MRNFYVYYLRRPDKLDYFDSSKHQPFYVGKGCNGRHLEHRKEAFDLLHKLGKKKYKIAIIHSLWKQGADFEEDIVFDNLAEQEAFDLEKEIIEMYGRKDNNTGLLANLTNGGKGGMSGYNPSIETRQKLRDVILQLSDEEKTERNKRISLALSGENHYNYGKHRSLETKEKLREANLGKVVPEETRLKIGVTLKGRISNRKGVKQSPETIEKRRKALLGKPRSLETKEKIRQAAIGRKHTPEAKEKMRQAKLKRKKGN